MLLEAGVADGGRPHVDAAAARSKIVRRADERDLAISRLHAHGRKANVPP